MRIGLALCMFYVKTMEHSYGFCSNFAKYDCLPRILTCLQKVGKKITQKYDSITRILGRQKKIEIHPKI